MTREEAIKRKRELEMKRERLIDRLTEIDVASASISSGTGSRSYTNRSIAELQKQIRAIDNEIDRYARKLGGLPSKGDILSIYPKFK